MNHLIPVILLKNLLFKGEDIKRAKERHQMKNKSSEEHMEGCNGSLERTNSLERISSVRLSEQIRLSEF